MKWYWRLTSACWTCLNDTARNKAELDEKVYRLMVNREVVVEAESYAHARRIMETTKTRRGVMRQPQTA